MSGFAFDVTVSVCETLYVDGSVNAHRMLYALGAIVCISLAQRQAFEKLFRILKRMNKIEFTQTSFINITEDEFNSFCFSKLTEFVEKC